MKRALILFIASWPVVGMCDNAEGTGHPEQVTNVLTWLASFWPF